MNGTFAANSPLSGLKGSLGAQLAGLPSLDEAELHRIWRVRIGRKVPSHLPRALFLRLLAYQLQAQALGDLDPAFRSRLDQIVANNRRGRGQSNPSHSAVNLRPGSVLVREHDDELHRVMVLEGGFAWGGKTYRSLSETAFAITGTKWNGHRFFGLDRKPKSPAERKAKS
ncbi:DUF2924 domain-containing protein [soil metagenome]